MKRLKFIIHIIVNIALLVVVICLVVGVFKAMKDFPYKKTFNDFQRASYTEVRFMRLQKAEKDREGSFRNSRKKILQVEDSLYRREDSLYNVVREFPERFRDFASAAEEMHEQTLILREIRRRGFKSERDEIFSDYEHVLDSITDVHFDCSIIKKKEDKRRI